MVSVSSQVESLLNYRHSGAKSLRSEHQFCNYSDALCSYSLVTIDLKVVSALPTQVGSSHLVVSNSG